MSVETEESGYWLTTGIMNVSKQIFDQTPLLKDLLVGTICFRHNSPAAGPHLQWHCFFCERDYECVWKRPPREGGDTCYECGQTTPKGPKRPKQWLWREAKPEDGSL